jgi:hypothetical protein
MVPMKRQPPTEFTAAHVRATELFRESAEELRTRIGKLRLAIAACRYATGELHTIAPHTVEMFRYGTRGQSTVEGAVGAIEFCFDARGELVCSFARSRWFWREPGRICEVVLRAPADYRLQSASVYELDEHDQHVVRVVALNRMKQWMTIHYTGPAAHPAGATVDGTVYPSPSTYDFWYDGDQTLACVFSRSEGRVVYSRRSVDVEGALLLLREELTNDIERWLTQSSHRLRVVALSYNSASSAEICPPDVVAGTEPAAKDRLDDLADPASWAKDRLTPSKKTAALSSAVRLGIQSEDDVLKVKRLYAEVAQRLNETHARDSTFVALDIDHATGLNPQPLTNEQRAALGL